MKKKIIGAVLVALMLGGAVTVSALDLPDAEIEAAEEVETIVLSETFEEASEAPVLYADGTADTITLTPDDNGVCKLDLKIHLKGDITGDGKVTILDVNKANLAHQGKLELTEYEKACGDVNNSETVTIIDVNLLNLHYQGKNPLW